MVSKEITMTKKNVKSAKDAIMLHLKRRTITSQQAIDLYGATRLSAIIFNLREKGYNIVTHDVKAKNRFGHARTIAKYQYIKPS